MSDIVYIIILFIITNLLESFFFLVLGRNLSLDQETLYIRIIIKVD